MKTSQRILLGITLFAVIQFTAGNHHSNCGLGPGVDACGCGCTETTIKAAKLIRPTKLVEPYVINEAHIIKKSPPRQGCGSLNPPRPHSGPTVIDLLKPSCGPVAPKFRPIGDLCSKCSKTITEVVPAYPGKPPCNVEPPRLCDCSRDDSYYSKPCKHISYASTNPELNAFEDECISFDEQEKIYNGQPAPTAPADPVSLSLAYGLARQAARIVPESRLAFGQKSLPIDGRIRQTKTDIPEERLLTVDRPIVELKQTFVQPSSNDYAEIIAEQEALEQKRMELEAKNSHTQSSSLISFSDIGYAPVSPSAQNFVSKIVSSHPDMGTIDDSACGPVGPTIPGYRSGNVIIRSESSRNNNDDDLSGEGSWEFDFDEVQDEGSSSEESDGSYDGSRFLARLRASARAQNKRRHPSGCGCGCGH
ncbi:uncharacterized protein LOC125499987 [Athalia rosae]|uniref:uncharacterized protein LOC125499987 n=1 Tax=Athalia rosae TaxID=37344 RepID=UPI002033DD90|nr:uncharacterized protein LOC125499987 [Athalia rosae]